MPIAFFDLDKTIIAKNSANLWLKTQWQEGKIDFRNMLKASYWLFKYHLGFTNFDDILEKSLAFVKDREDKKTIEETKIFYELSIKHLYRPGALQAIKEHKKEGHVTSLLTSGFESLAFLVKNELNLDYALCSKLEVNESGLYTGRTVGPMCFGKNKILFAQKLCNELKVDIKSCYFYTDSASDMPLLNLVENPIVVNPDPRLRASAQIKKWPVVDWGKPECKNL